MMVCGCGAKFDHKVTGLENSTVHVDLGFAEAMKVCDQRYGYKTPEAEACFRDYRNFTKVTFGLDLSAITKFCESSYPDDPVAIRNCSQDLIDLFDHLANPVN